MTKVGTPKYVRLLPQVRAIVSEYGGMHLTLRQVYYRLVARQASIRNCKPASGA